MKKIIVTSLCFLSLSAFAGEINVKVQGMVCSMCAQGIKKNFSKVNGVKDIKVDLDKKFVQILTNDGQDVGNDKINEVIKEAGYNVSSIERK
jgi:mercuric ion binding protein